MTHLSLTVVVVFFVFFDVRSLPNTSDFFILLTILLGSLQPTLTLPPSLQAFTTV